MKTIEKILHLHKTNYIELESLELNGYINGCWWKDWFNFDRYIKDILHSFKWFNKDKAESLYKDLRTICLCHDRAFHYKKGFYLSNYWMARDVFMISHKITNIWNRFWLSLWLFILLCKFWKKYYK